MLTVGKLNIGYSDDRETRSIVAETFHALARLSGLGKPKTAPTATIDREKFGSLFGDLWFVSSRQLRSRWRIVERPLVIRAYQHDAANRDALVMIGEGLATAPLDFVDFNLVNRYFPVLFVFLDPNGSIVNCELLPFPSLCRGGTHYPELLACNENGCGQPDPFELGSSIADRFLALGKGAESPLVTDIEVELDGADGTHPLFQADLQRWLERVPRIAVKGLPAEAPTIRTEYLLEAIALEPAGRRASGGGRLILASDMIPTLSILSAPSASNKAIRRDVFAPLLAATPDHSQPVVLLEMPRGRAPALRAGSPDYPPAWPRFLPSTRSGLPDALPPAAIRFTSGRALADAELMIPVMNGGLPMAEQRGEPITWLVVPSEWHGDSVKLGLEALALQAGAKKIAVGIAGTVSEDVRELAERLFGSRAHFAPSTPEVLKDIATPLVGYLGKGVILHDSRCATALSSLMRHEAVASATCVIVNAEKKGKGWHVSLADSGRLDRSGQAPRPFHEQAEYIQRLWRSTYPASSPSRDLWVTRSTNVVSWSGQSDFLSPGDGMHLCTSLVTASYAEGRIDGAPHLTLPPADQVNVARMEVLFG